MQKYPVMSSGRVKLQNLRDFTIQIRHTVTNAIVGTGILVSKDGKIVTCAHVAKMSGVDFQKSSEAEIIVYFPQAKHERDKEKLARVKAYFPQFDDDIILLQLVDQALPESIDEVAILGTMESSEFHEFRSYGYRPLDDYIAAYAEGKILGSVEVSKNQNVRCEPVQLQSSQINQGMSGAAVLDIERNLVVGIISETWYPDASTKDRDTAWAVNVRVLSFDPLRLPIQDASFPLRRAPQAELELLFDKKLDSLKPSSIFLQGEPPNLEEWAGRDTLLEQIHSDWCNLNCQVTSLIGFGGEGKTSIARHWLTQVFRGRVSPKPEGIFWWNFYSKPSVEEFFKAAFNYVGGSSLFNEEKPTIQAQIHFIAAMLSTYRYLFVLDGLEVMQYQGGDSYGILRDENFRNWLHFFASHGTTSFCLITSRSPVLDLVDFKTYTHRDVSRLSSSEGVSLLRRIGVTGDNAKLCEIVEKWDGHALTLSLLGTYLVEEQLGNISRVGELPLPTINESRYSRVHRVLRRYDHHLSENEKLLLTILSDDFRLPINKKILARSFYSKIMSLESQVNKLPYDSSIPSEKDIDISVKHLVLYGILRYDKRSRCFTTHPLIRSYYLTRWAKYLYEIGFGAYWELVNKCREANSIIFVLEKSWSMMIADRFLKARSLMVALVADIWQINVRVGIITVHKDKADVILSPTHNHERIQNALDQKALDTLGGGGKTPIAIGLIKAYKMLVNEKRRNKKVTPLIILMTDGASNVSLTSSKYEPDLKPLVEKVISRTKDNDAYEEAIVAAELIREDSVRSIVIDAEHPKFDQGLSKRIADALGGDCFQMDDLTLGWYEKDEGNEGLVILA